MKEITLFKHQIEGIEFLKKTKKAILAHEMGLGKTKMAIMAAGEISDEGILVICPASLKINWQREIAMVYQEDITAIISTTEIIKNVDIPAWFIINYDIIEKKKEFILDLIDRGIIGTVILDEAHYIKGKDATRSKATLEITKKAKRVYCLTGTPLMNRPAELFNLLKAIDHPLGKARATFVKRYCGGELKIMVKDLTSGKMFFTSYRQSFAFRSQKKQYRVYMFTDETGATRLPELHKFTEDVILRRTKKEVLDLPEKIISVQICEFDKKNQELYDSAWDRYIEWVANNPQGKNLENILNAQQLVEIGKLKQVCSLSKIRIIKESVINAVEQGEKVLIFSQYTATIDVLYQELKEIGVVTLTGQDDMDQRQRAVDSFQLNPLTKVMIANIKAGGVGLNLTEASIVMFADMEWSPEIHHQAEDRAHRIGTEGTVNVYYYIVKDTIEEDIADMLVNKESIIGSVIEGTKYKGSPMKNILDKLSNRVVKYNHDKKV